jgi:hypothetical protein
MALPPIDTFQKAESQTLPSQIATAMVALAPTWARTTPLFSSQEADAETATSSATRSTPATSTRARPPW